ncbi:MAG TPA: hypothetical protein VN643_23530 [Pyrinomonadaceae bacterium]|nr:hypothetical protein [Pyrinomonadaceae bacterium]
MLSSALKLTIQLSLCVLLFAACGTPTNTNTNTNSNANITANTNAAPANANTSAESLAVITAREPDKYRATLTLSAETENGEKTIGMPTLSVAIARSGDSRRVSFKMPDGSDLIYIDTTDHHYVVLPARKQYAELTPDAVGFQIQRLMTPGQIVKHLERLKGVQQAGEEKFNGRTAMKYSYSSQVDTKTQAGEVKNQGFVYIDKDTGLPLRAELLAQASGEVKGVKSAKIVAEMRDISTDVDAAQFEVPAGLNKIPPEQIRSHIDAITSAATALVKALLANMNAAPPAAASPSPSASANP